MVDKGFTIPAGAGWITLLVALGVAMIKLIIWPLPDAPPQPVVQPRGLA
jgi:hypothetical protein